MQSKIKIRKAARELCQKISPTYREEAAKTAATIFTQQALFKQSEHIACYLAIKNEFDATPLIEAIWAAKKQCYLPVLAPKDEKTLCFVRYVYGDALHLNRYSILEPVNTAREMTPANLDLVITPVVAFDLQGHRVGTGGGYYDRTFAFLNAEKRAKPKMVGVAYEAQAVNSLTPDPWDIRLNAILTEKKFILCS